jgi:putative drug exporter of the RND superfamily
VATTTTTRPGHPATEPRRPATVRVARWSATHPWRAIAVWVAFVAAALLIGGSVGTKEVSDLDTTVGQAGSAAHAIRDAGLESPDTEDVLLTPRAGTTVATAERVAADVARQMKAVSGAAGVADPVSAPRGKAVLVEVTLDRSVTSAKPFQAVTEAVQRAHPELRVEQAGSLSINDAVDQQVGADLSAAAEYSLPVTLVILLVAFGAILAAGVPVLLALSAVATATGLSALVSHVIPDSGSTSSMILLMGMAVGVDYSLFYVKRAREERQRGRTHLDAIEIAAETSGHSVLVSGAAVIVSMLGLFLVRDVVFASLAAGSIVVVAVAVLGSLTVVPAVLVKLGRAVDRPRVPFLWRLAAQTHEPRLWPAILKPALHRPGRTLVVTVALLGALAVPALGMKLSSDTARSLPASIPEVQTLNRITTAFPSRNTSHFIVVEAAKDRAKTVTARLVALRDKAAASPLFASAAEGQAPMHASKDGTVHVLEVDTPYDAETTQAHRALEVLRGDLVPQLTAGIPGAKAWVGGDTAESVDEDHHLAVGLPWVIAFVVLLTMLIMGWVFRSVVIAITTALVNLLSAGAAFGVLVLTFQHTWSQKLLGFSSTGAVINWVPLFTFAVLFGLSMDYHVFVISRIREAAAEGLSTRAAVERGITRSAGTVTSAAIVMVSVFAIFASLHMIEMKELGLSLAAAVLIDALVIRVVVLPALMTLLGRFNWWPGPLSRRRVAVAGSSPVVPGELVGSRS